jgi:hypothetical protein
MAPVPSVNDQAAEFGVVSSLPHMAERYGVQADQTPETGLLDMIFADTQWS